MRTTPPTEESIFTQALDLPDSVARSALLDAACGSDAELRKRVEGLLQSHGDAGSFLATPASTIACCAGEPMTEKPGMHIGPYKLLQQIGEGGMGVVYMAEQEKPVRRRVALKIIKPGMDSHQVIARFESERQALAMMDHQNIARVLDAGATPSGRPYFVMELVHGVPLVKFCDDSRLTLQQRLELFVQICHAIQHAHQKGIIHRDLKASNILVTMYDDKPTPKVIDFGVAKAIEQRLTEKTLFTQYGMLVGTFEYMSPEQAEMNALGVDTRSDIYSLGVLLYELLTGTTPLERPTVREAALMEVVRLIKEQEAPRPSVRLTTSGTLNKVAAACQTEAARLPQLLQGELDWIVMKCLEKDRTRRYETANGLARDVERYLHDEPVEACPPSVMYRLRKAARKHRRLLTAATCFAALLVAAAAVSTALATWAMRSEAAATAARNHAESALKRETAAHADAEAARAKAETYADRLSRATRFASEGIGSYYRGNWNEANDRFAKAVQAEPDLAITYLYRGPMYAKLGLWDRAADDYDHRVRLGMGADPQTYFEHVVLKAYLGDDAGYRRMCQEMIQQHGWSSSTDDRQLILRACTLSPKTVGDAQGLARRGEGTISSSYRPWTLSHAGVAHLRAGNLDQAVARLDEALENAPNSPGGVHRFSHFPLAMALFRQGKASEAQNSLAKGRQAIEEWTQAMVRNPSGTMPISWSDWLECNIFYREAEELINGAVPPEDPRLIAVYERALATITTGDASTFMDAGRKQVVRKAWNEAAADFARALEQMRYGTPFLRNETRMSLEMVRQPEVFAQLVQLRPTDWRIWLARGRLFANQRKWDQAAADYTRTMQLQEAASADEAVAADLEVLRTRAEVMHELASLRLLTADRAGYLELCTIVVRSHEKTDDAVTLNLACRTLAQSPGGASESQSKAIRFGELAVAKFPDFAWNRFALALACCRAGRDADAIKGLEESLRMHPAWVGRGQNHALLAIACAHLNRNTEARDWLGRAQTLVKETDATYSKYVFGYASTEYLGDWLSLQVLLREADALVNGVADPSGAR
jgi:serine/threonine protein kinase